MSKLSVIVTLLFLTVTLLFVRATYVKEPYEYCEQLNNCTECIRIAGCSFCSQEGNYHCFDPKQEIKTKTCLGEIISPKSDITFVKNIPVQLSPTLEPIQLQPQNVRLKMRNGQSYKLKFKYGQARNFPIDLYYLMDLSASMRDEKRILSEVGNKLIAVMRKISSNFRIGFGSFVDKTTAPYISMAPFKPNTMGCRECVKPYSFQNHMSLSDGLKFSEEVERAPLSGNIDEPEGGLDALMQAMVCKEEIGWREHAKRLIVYSSDAPFHFAGDGKLAGIVTPNDAKCHLENNSYTHDLIFDYPSVSHINYVAKENNFYILFAVTNEQLLIYERLPRAVENSRVVPLTKTTQIPEIVQDFYYNVTSNIRMTYKASENVEVEFSSNCTNAIDNGCSDVHIGEVVEFTADISILNCLEDGKETVSIQPNNLQEKILVELEVPCSCQCSDFEAKSRKCSEKGDFHCGNCECPEGFSGQTCECNTLEDGGKYADANCVQGNETCSGLGTCLCGICQCYERQNPREKLYGKYCECDNFSCAKLDGLLCSGNGHCDCGRCKCNAEWAGEICECSKDHTTCTINDQVCNKKGTCECGKCKCEEGFYGQYCQECVTCEGGKCEDLRPCVECKVFQIGKFKEPSMCDSNCQNYNIATINNGEQGTIADKEAKTCRLLVENGCFMSFNYVYGKDEEILIEVKKDFECPEPLNVPVLVSSIIGSIILIGVVTVLVWKSFVIWHDKRSFQRFQEERSRAKWNANDNPLFRNPVNTFQNPAYARKSLFGD